MIHPLLARLATQPGLLVEHAGAYAELAAVEAAELGRRWQQRALLSALAGGCTLLFLGLAGVAALLAGALPMETMPQAWLLAAVPALPLLVALGCVARLLHCRAPNKAFAHLREQLATDAQLAREQIEPR